MLYRVKKSVRRAMRPIEAAVYPRLFAEKDCLTVILLHSVFRDRAEISKEHIDPLEHTTVDSLRRFVEYFLKHGYVFVSPEDLTRGLEPGGRHILLTFDDGYANFLHVVPLLDEYDIRATLFAVSRNTQENRCFWWDVLYRNGRKQGASRQELAEQGAELQELQPEKINRHLTARFGNDAFRPLGDVDRPLTAGELKALSQDARVTIGNHTADHANLARCNDETVRRQIIESQQALEEMTGVTPSAISYPFGRVSAKVVETCRQLGLTVGITTVSDFNRIPRDIRADRRLSLGRFNPSFRDGGCDQAEAIRRRVLISQVHETLFGRRPFNRLVYASGGEGP